MTQSRDFIYLQDAHQPTVVDQIWQWKQTSLFWTMPGLQQADFHHVSAVVDLFMQAAAFPGKHPTLGLSQNALSADQHAAVQILVDKGYVEERQVAHVALLCFYSGWDVSHASGKHLGQPNASLCSRGSGAGEGQGRV